MSTALANVQIDEEHSRAICEEIGDRLRVALGGPLPASAVLDSLVARLIELGEHESPSIVPAIDNAEVEVEASI